MSKTGSPTGNGFSDADVAAIKQSIRAEFGKERGLTVEDVVLMKESPRELGSGNPFHLETRRRKLRARRLSVPSNLRPSEVSTSNVLLAIH